MKSLKTWRAKNPASALMLLVDLIVHSWRTWHQIVQWSRRKPIAFAAILDGAAGSAQDSYNWGKQDPMYALMLERYPEKKS